MNDLARAGIECLIDIDGQMHSLSLVQTVLINNFHFEHLYENADWSTEHTVNLYYD